MKYAPSLRFLFIVTVSFLALFLTVFLTYFLSKQYREEAVKHARHYAETVAQDMALAATDYIITENFSSLQDLIFAYHSRTHLKEITVINIHGTIIASSRRELLGKRVNLPSSFEKQDNTEADFNSNILTVRYQLPIRIDDTVIGWSKIQVDTEYLKKSITALQRQAFLTGIIGWLLACILAFALSIFINRAIESIVQASRRAALGHFDTRTKIQGPQEFRQLSTAFNSMIDAIGSRTKLLEASEKRYRSLVEEIHDWVWEIDTNGVRTEVSPSIEKIFGYTSVELIGKSIFESMPASKEQEARMMFAELVATKLPFRNFVHSQYHRDGREIIIETSGQPIFDQDGAVAGFRGVARDITKRQQAEEALQAEKERLSVTLRSIGDGVITTNTRGNILFLNRVAEELTGWTNAEAEGKPASEIFTLMDNASQQIGRDPVREVLDSRTTPGTNHHTTLIAKDGTVRAIADSSAPILDKKNAIIGVVLVFRDITHEQKTSEELLKIRKLESVGVLAGGIAHDFNNILSAILGNIELAGQRLAKEDYQTAALLSNARKASRRAAKLTDQLLTFSKGGEPVKEQIALPELIRESAEFVLHGSNVACSYLFSEDLCLVDVDSGQISQVVQNIILNAKHAMPDGGTITIQCTNIIDITTEEVLPTAKGRYVKITLKDTGAGITEEIIDKIFDPYFTTKETGSGLGLAISHSIVKKHNGYITVHSLPEEGTTFTLYLPATQPKQEQSTEESKETVQVPGLKIMFMDDDPMLLTVVEAQLLALGHEPILVTNGYQAIDRYTELKNQSCPIDIVIMDLTIPGSMGGQKAVQKLLEIDPAAKVIVSSGYSNDPIMADHHRYGFCAAIIKPFDLQGLSDAISSALD